VNISSKRYLIIGGATKCATTSLFKYLSDNPQICGSSIKETGFFLDKDYPIKKKYNYEDGFDEYMSYFSDCCDKKVFLEASPDYLYSFGTPKKIDEALSDFLVVFILRDPVERFISWYRFALQTKKIKKCLTMKAFYEIQVDEKSTKQHELVLIQGNYSEYLKRYYDIIGKERVKILFYEEFKKDPYRALRSLLYDINVDVGFYADYDFKIYNKTEVIKYVGMYAFVRSVKKRLVEMFSSNVNVLKVFKRINKILDLEKYFIDSEASVKIDESVVDKLRQYYKDEGVKIESIIGQKVPW